MITEVLMSQGSWELEISPAAPIGLWSELKKFGHIVITSQRVEPELLDDAGMLAAARYVGVLLEKEQGEGLSIGGKGMVWWLGDEEDKGQIIELELQFEDNLLVDTINALLPDAVTLGTVTEPSGLTYTGTHQWETPLEAIRTACASLGCEFKVNNDATIDAGPKESLFVITTPRVVVTGDVGKDPTYLAVDSDEITLSLDANPYASRIIVVAEDSDNVRSLIGYVDRTPAPEEVDMHGNLVNRVRMVETFGEPVAVATYVLSILNDSAEIAEINISTVFRDIAEGNFAVGDGFYVYQPPGFVDSANEINFRGEIIHPVLLRLLQASWGVHSGMGVYYRTPEATPRYVDLNRFVVREDETASGRVT